MAKPAADHIDTGAMQATVCASKNEGLVIVELSIADVRCRFDASGRRIRTSLALNHAEAQELTKALSKAARRIRDVA